MAAISHFVPRENSVCAICQNTVTSRRWVFHRENDGDKHPFHSQCLATWLKRQRACPVCREPIKDSLNSKLRLVVGALKIAAASSYGTLKKTECSFLFVMIAASNACLPLLFGEGMRNGCETVLGGMALIGVFLGGVTRADDEDKQKLIARTGAPMVIPFALLHLWRSGSVNHHILRGVGQVALFHAVKKKHLAVGALVQVLFQTLGSGKMELSWKSAYIGALFFRDIHLLREAGQWGRWIYQMM